MFTLKNLLVVIGRAALISLGAIFIASIAIFFLSSQIKRMSDAVALNHRLESELQKRTGLIEVLKHDSQIVGTNNTLIQNAFAPADNILGFINTLDSLAAKNSITQTYNFEVPVPSPIAAPFPISTIGYTNRFDSTLQGFTGYIKQFNKLPYYTKIDGFTIASQDKLGWTGSATITYHATLYSNAQ